MPNLVTTIVDQGSVLLKDGQYEQDKALTFAGAATVLAGTILAVTTATGKYTPFVIGGAGGAEIPKAVLVSDVTAEGAGDEVIFPLVAGSVRAERLIVAADGDDSNITKAILDQLRDYSIVALSVDDISVLDN